MTRTARRSHRAADIRAQLAQHAAQLEAQAARTGRPVTFWSALPGIPRATIEARRAELRAIEANPHGLISTGCRWLTVEDAAFGARRAA